MIQARFFFGSRVSRLFVIDLLLSFLGLPQIHLVATRALMENATKHLAFYFFHHHKSDSSCGAHPDQQHKELYSIFPMYRSLPTAAATAGGTRKQATMHAMLIPFAPKDSRVRENDPAPRSVPFVVFLFA